MPVELRLSSRLTLRGVIVAVLLSASSAFAGGVEDDPVAAYKRGDYATAIQLLRPLAMQGSPIAQFDLGLMYDEGQGVPKDDQEALKWYRKAAEQGYAPAQTNLGRAYAWGLGIERDVVLAYMWLNLAAAQGVFEAKDQRDWVVDFMSRAQIDEAQRLAREWKPTK